ncbi:DUF1853 family protein [Cupriavidus sp. 2TAF22]|uniref:DUF1853 family protein n=1 Tax=unclassified Cupriavidus TaxID=2640874 RepID=UPI003F92E9D3
MREPRPDAALSPGGAIEMASLWRHAVSQRLRELAWCSLSPPLLAFLPAGHVGGGTDGSDGADGAINGHVNGSINGNFNGNLSVGGALGGVPDGSPGSIVQGASADTPAAHIAAGLAHWPDGALAAWQRWLLCADPASLPLTIAELAAGREHPRARGPAHAPSLRLGRHAERLLQFTLEHTAGLELLAANLPVRRAAAHGVQTLGELDFVWRDTRSGATVHWEMAAKFYLLVGPDASAGHGDAAPPRLHHFVGPNLVDRLGDKLGHLVHRQLPLSRAPEALALLGRTVDRSEVYLLGWLFYRNGVVPAGVRDLGIAPDHLHGWWSALQDWSAWAATRTGSRWYRLPRSAWMAPAMVAQAHTEPLEAVREALAQRFAETQHDKVWRREAPVMLCELEPAGASAPGLWRECSRGFVVPPGWEERARQRVAALPE